MELSWMRAMRLSKEYENEVIQFLEFAEKTFLTIMRFFGVLVQFAEIRKKKTKGCYIQSFRF